MSKKFWIVASGVSLVVFMGLYAHLCYSMWVLLIERFYPIEGPGDLIGIFVSTGLALVVLIVGAIESTGIMFGAGIGPSSKSEKIEQKKR